MSCKRQDLLNLCEHLSSPPVFGAVRVAHRFSIFFFLVLSLRSEFRVVMSVAISKSKIMFGSSLPAVGFRRAHVSFTLFVFAWEYWCPTHIVFFCDMFVFTLSTICCQFLCIVHFWLPHRYPLTLIRQMLIKEISDFSKSRVVPRILLLI